MDRGAWVVFVAILLQSLSTGSCRPTDNCPVVTFSCPPLPPLTEPAKDVYSLRPQDIKVVMALGDSVTAGALRVQKECCSVPHPLPLLALYAYSDMH